MWEPCFMVCILMLSVLCCSFKNVIASPSGRGLDRQSLLALKDQLVNDSSAGPLSSWNDSSEICAWEGVRCGSRHVRVTSLILNGSRLSGSISPSIGNLSFLRHVILSDNMLQGSLPKELGHLRRLRSLIVEDNNLQGRIPLELTTCSELKLLALSYNNLTGHIPPGLGSLVYLTWLSLGENSFTGNIPSSLVNLTSLTYLALSGNHLDGGIPHGVGKLSGLESLLLSRNSLQGDLPHSVFNLTSLEYLDMAVNYLSGELISEIDVSFPNLQKLTLGQNQFTGTIPASCSNISGLQLFDLSANAFTGPMPNELGRLVNLKHLVLGRNNLGNGNEEDLDFIASLSNCTKLISLSLEGNGLGGTIPESVSNLSTKIMRIHMGWNQISGAIPAGIGNHIGLTDLELQVNKFTGSVPDSLGRLKNLGRLWLHRNQLSGNVPSFIGNLSKLFDLRLHINNFNGQIPLGLKDCTNMQYLLISRNKISGHVPDQLFGSLSGLVLLHISGNSLTGALPTDLGNLKNLVELHVNQNKLSGDIPSGLGQCSGLVTLVMGGNYFSGSIPSSLSSLKSLETLNLSRNNLSGKIPHRLAKLTYLSCLDVSYNYLEGDVPKGGVFQNARGISVIGNQKLCGGIPELQIPKCLQNKANSVLSTKAIIVVVVIPSALLSLVLATIAFLIVRKKQRSRRVLAPQVSLGDSFLRISYEELLKATGSFAPSNLIGSGSFGAVYKGFLSEQQKHIAVKVLDLQTVGAAKSFIAECKALSNIRHRNLLKMVTSCSSMDYQGHDFKALVFELMPNGSLSSWLHEDEAPEPRNFSFVQRVDIALDVANALFYLHHQCETPIVHCDLKPRNVLIDEDMVAHVSDFGLARLLSESSSNLGRDQTSSSFFVRGTIGYIAPEYGTGIIVSPEGDIYSYGILLLEMITGRRPTESSFGGNLSLRKFVKMALPYCIKEITDTNLLEEFSGDEMGESLVSFAGVGVSCSAEDPSERMRISDAIKELLAIKSRLIYGC